MNIRFILLVMPALLAACSPLTVDDGPSERYRLEAEERSPVSEWVLPRSLVVVEPKLPTILDTEHITLFFDSLRVDRYAGARWSDRLSGLIHGVTIDIVEQLHGESVDPYLQRSPDYVIRTVVRDFQAMYANDSADRVPRLKVGLSLVLVETATDRIMAEARASRTVAATANRMGPVVGELNALLLGVLEDALRELNRQLLDEGDYPLSPRQ